VIYNRGDRGISRMAKELSRREKADMKILVRFVAVFCREKHEGEKRPSAIDVPGLENVAPGVELCPECARLLRYAIAMRRRCAQEPKPACKKCPTPCYRPEHRERVRAVMRFSSTYLLKRGRLDLLLHYLL
jgi:hypothetical protein